MGQNQSTKEVLPKGPPPRPKAPPTSKPLSDLGPKGPKIHKPENRVLPTVLPNTRSLLRPVSQELGDVHPEFKDIFAQEENENDENTDFDFNNDELPLNGDAVHQNGGINIPNGNIPNGHGPRNSDIGGAVSSASNSASKYRVHRRQQSASSSLYTRENTILEDPEESNLELRGKLDPLSTSCPQVSIPIKSSFNMDSSMNMTYVQLAEARRNKTLSMIEQRTGRKIDDLSSDLSEHASQPVINLSRTNSMKSERNSVVSFNEPKKKKKAPAPPQQPPPGPPIATRSAPNTPKSMVRSKSQQAPPRPLSPPIIRGYSWDNEPPADYDVDIPYSPRSNNIQNSNRFSQNGFPSHNSLPSQQTNIPSPPPLPTGILKTANNSSNKSRDGFNENPVIHLKRTSSQRVVPSPEPKAHDSMLMEIQRLAENRAARRQMSENSETPKPVFNGADISTNNDDDDKLLLQKQESTEEEIIPPPPVLDRQISAEGNKSLVPPPVAEKTFSTLERKNSNSSSSSRASSTPSSKTSDPAVRRLSSLLQHDIKIAAQSKATKMVKKQTPVKEKPKDPAEMFKEELLKAKAEREKRNITSTSIDEKMRNKKAAEVKSSLPYEEDVTVFKSNEVVVKRTSSFKEDVKKDEKETIKLNSDNLPLPSLKSEEKPSSSGRNSLINSRQRISVDESVKEWAPEDDLDSDDDLSDEETMTGRKGHSEGFKSSIVPGKVNDLKSVGKVKSKENKYNKKTSDNDERRKSDSIKRFKKSVHKSVKNAFGSIGRAGGKLMKRGKSEELERPSAPPPPVPSNWKLSSSASDPDLLNDDHQTHYSHQFEKRHSLGSERALKYVVPNGHAGAESDNDSEEENMEEVKQELKFSDALVPDNSDSDESPEEISSMKRAGVAYVGKKGQIVVLPEYETVQVNKDGQVINDFEGHAPKIFQKKKKFAFDATVRRKEREKEGERIAEIVKEKEQQREMERKQGVQTEEEYQKLRALEAQREREARERLQRLETEAQRQQQLLQQQQQQLGIMTVPPLPPPTGFQQGYNPSIDYSQIFAAQTGLGQPGFGLQYGNSQPLFNGGMYPSMSNMTPYELTEYMRVMGMVGAPVPNPQQQYAFMFNSVNWANPGLIDRSKYFPTKMSSQEQLDSERNQVFNNWVGPTKQPASKANVIITNGSTSNLSSQQFGASSVSGGARPGSQPLRTNIMINDNESDTSDGLSPQKTDAAMAKLQQTPQDQVTVEEGGHRTKISIVNALPSQDNSYNTVRFAENS